jgi:hypothetical protein
MVAVTTLPVCDPGQALPLGRAIALALIGDDDAWHVLPPLEERTTDLLRRVLVAAALHQAVEAVVVWSDGAPQVLALPVERQKHVVQVPCVAWFGTSTLPPIGVVLANLPTPLPDGLVGHVAAALAQECLHVALAQRAAIIEPAPRADALAGAAMVLVAYAVSGWRHVACLSSG